MTAAATLLSFLLVVAVPAAACVFWTRRARDADAIDLTAVAYGGVGVSAITLWIGASAFGLSVWVCLLSPLVGAAALFGAARIEGSVGRVRARPSPERHLHWLVGMALLFVVLVAVLFAPFGLERAGQVHRFAMTDWYKHLIVTTALDGADAFPPNNPFLHTVPDAPYYYGFHLVAASIERVAGQRCGDVFFVLLGLTLLTAAAVPFVVYAFARRVCGDAQALWAAAAATFLSGFDLVPLAIDVVRDVASHWVLPTGFAALRAIIPSTHVDYWIHHNERQLNSLYLSTSWAPQHVAGVLLALLLFWLVAMPRREAPGDDARSRAEGPPARHLSGFGVLLPALLIAALPAISAYVAIGTAFAVLAILVVEAWRERQAAFPLIGRWASSGILGAILALPVLGVLSSSAAPGLVWHVSSAGSWKNGAFFTWVFGEHLWTSLLDTPAFLLFEYGVVGVLAVMELIRRSRGDGLRARERRIAVGAGAILVLATFVRPPVGGPNNLFARPAVLVFVLLAPFAAMAAARIGRSRAVRAGVLLCAMATAYVLVGNLLEAIFWAAPVGQVEAMRWVNDNTTRTALVAVSPADYDGYFSYWLRRPLLIADRRHALLFGATTEEFAAGTARATRAYAAPGPREAAARFDELGTGVIFVKVARSTSERRPEWARAPCFEVGFESVSWIVVRRLEGECHAIE